MPTAAEAGSLLWFDHPQETWCPAKALTGGRGSEAVRIEIIGSGEQRTEPVDSPKLMAMNKQNLEPAADMVKLGDLHEAALLHNIRLRFSRDDIFTYIGPILVACNPYKPLPIFTPEYVQRYHAAPAAAKVEPPHVYGVACNAYTNMLSEGGQNQSIVISGESGAGKTEETKLCLQFLAQVASASTGRSESGVVSPEQLLLASSPILEAMGNAKTIRNNNSSRFGKYMQIRFNPKGKIVGGSIVKYLLEKVRVVQQAANERNYHIFYLLRGLPASEKNRLGYTSPDEFVYCSGGGCTSVEGLDDLAELGYFRDAWQMVLSAGAVPGQASDGAAAAELESNLFGMVGAILHLGNIRFESDDDGHARCATKGPRSLQSSAALAQAALLFANDAAQLEKTLTLRSMKQRTEVIIIPLNVEQAVESQEGLAKAAYSRTFDWVVGCLNHAVESQTEAIHCTIGVLDIFGFEIFECNSFEQLCINLANEKLQGHFNDHIFKLEMATYAAEGLDCRRITFQDNQPIIDLIEKKPLGLLPLVDDECVVPRGSDATLLEKLQQAHKGKSKYWGAPPRSRSRSSELELNFVIHHYAGPVLYSANGFLAKNRDILQSDLEYYMANSQSCFIKGLFTQASDNDDTRNTKKGSNKQPTLGGQFRSSLHELYVKLTSTAPHFIKCVKTNQVKRAGLFDSHFCLQQIEYLGLLEVVKIRRQGYPVRRRPEAFVSRYALLESNSVPGVKPDATLLLKQIGTPGLWQVGKTLVFMKDEQLQLLERARAVTLDSTVRILQSAMRTFDKIAHWKKTARGFRSLITLCRGGHARILTRKMRTVRTAYLCLHKEMVALQVRFPPPPIMTGLQSALGAAQELLEPSAAQELTHDGHTVAGYDELVALTRSARAFEQRICAEIQIMEVLTPSLALKDEDNCEAALEKAAELIPPMQNETIRSATIFMASRSEARAAAKAAAEKAGMYEGMEKALAGAGVAVLASAGVIASGGSSNKVVPTAKVFRGSTATELREQMQTLRAAADLARKHGAEDDLMVGECEAVASELALTLAALGSLSAAVADGTKAAIVAAVDAAKAAGAGQVALGEGERALLEISLAEQIESLVVQELALRGEGTRTSTQLQLQLVAKKNEIFARAEEAGIEPERIANGVTYGADQSPRLPVSAATNNKRVEATGSYGTLRSARKATPARPESARILAKAIAPGPFVAQLDALAADCASLVHYPGLRRQHSDAVAVWLTSGGGSGPLVPSSLENPLTVLASRQIGGTEVAEKHAVRAFALLLSWCGVAIESAGSMNTHEEAAGQGAELLTIAAAETDLRTELYLQVMLLCSGNTSPDITVKIFQLRAWQMLALYVKHIGPPSGALLQYLLVLLYTTFASSLMGKCAQETIAGGGSGGRLAMIAQQSLRRLRRRDPSSSSGGMIRTNSSNFNGGAEITSASRIPSENDLLNLLSAAEVMSAPSSRKPSVASVMSGSTNTSEDEVATVPVQLPDGVVLRFALLDADEETGAAGGGETIVSELLESISVSQGMQKIDTYGLYLACPVPATSAANDTQRLVNLTLLDPRAVITALGLRRAGNGGSNVGKRLCLGKRLFVESVPEIAKCTDQVEIRLMFSQCVHCVVRGKYAPATLEKAVRLVALAIRVGLHGENLVSGAPDETLLQRELAQNVPPRFFSTQPLAMWTAQLTALLPTLSDLTNHHARREYVKICAGCRGYGLSLYYAQQTHLPEKRAPHCVLLGVGVDGVSVRDPVDLSCIERYRFSKLRSWGIVASPDSTQDAAAAGSGNPNARSSNAPGYRTARVTQSSRLALRVLPDGAHHTLCRQDVFFDLLPSPAPPFGTARTVVVEESPGVAAAEICGLLREYGRYLAAKRLRETKAQQSNVGAQQ